MLANVINVKWNAWSTMIVAVDESVKPVLHYKLLASLCDSQYEALILKCKLQIGYRNKLAINLCRTLRVTNWLITVECKKNNRLWLVNFLLLQPHLLGIRYCKSETSVCSFTSTIVRQFASFCYMSSHLHSVLTFLEPIELLDLLRIQKLHLAIQIWCVGVLFFYNARDICYNIRALWGLRFALSNATKRPSS